MRISLHPQWVLFDENQPPPQRVLFDENQPPPTTDGFCLMRISIYPQRVLFDENQPPPTMDGFCLMRISLHHNGTDEKVSHLLFVDYIIIFMKASLGNCRMLREMMNEYEVAVGQWVNYDKSSLFFSGNFGVNMQEELKRCVDIRGEGPERRWNEDLLNVCFSDSQVRAIKSIPLCSDLVDDQLIWNANSKGIYTTKLGYYVEMKLLYNSYRFEGETGGFGSE
ncbi:hypothetical protein ACFE04_011615 [Oxalis oulophora]